MDKKRENSKIGKLAVMKGYTKPAEIEEALKVQATDRSKRLGQILVERKAMTQARIDELLSLQDEIRAGRIPEEIKASMGFSFD